MSKRVLIAGSGVAAVEAVLALRHLAGRGFEIEMVAPAHALEHRPASVAAPFGFGAPPPLDLPTSRAATTSTLVEGELAASMSMGSAPVSRPAACATYDHLLIAVGARPEPALPGALTFRRPRGCADGRVGGRRGPRAGIGASS